jgi:hypothetical protein
MSNSQPLGHVDLGRGSKTRSRLGDGFTVDAEGSIMDCVGSVLGSQDSLEVGSPEGRVPISSLEEPTSKPLIQYKRNGRRPKMSVGQGRPE